MKNLHLLVVLFLIFSLDLTAQKNTISTGIGISKLYSNNKEFQKSLYEELFYIECNRSIKKIKNINFGLSSQLFYSKLTFKNNFYVPTIGNVSLLFWHKINIFQLNVPLSITLHYPNSYLKNYLVSFKFGPSFILHSNRQINMITSYSGKIIEDTSIVTNGLFSMAKPIGFISHFEISRNLVLFKKTLKINANTYFDLTNKEYPTKNDPLNSKFIVKQLSFYLGIGYSF